MRAIRCLFCKQNREPHNSTCISSTGRSSGSARCCVYMADLCSFINCNNINIAISLFPWTWGKYSVMSENGLPDEMTSLVVKTCETIWINLYPNALCNVKKSLKAHLDERIGRFCNTYVSTYHISRRILRYSSEKFSKCPFLWLNTSMINDLDRIIS